MNKTIYFVKESFLLKKLVKRRAKILLRFNEHYISQVLTYSYLQNCNLVVYHN